MALYANTTNKLSSERYLANKEYFDNGLIELLEKQQNQIVKHKEKENVYKATLVQKNALIRTLKFKLKDRNDIVFNLHNKIKITTENADEIMEKLQKEINDISKSVDNELHNSYQENAKLHDENTRLKEELKKLRRRGLSNKLNSLNSSKPPSTDGFLIRANMRKSTNLKRGGQLKHKGHFSHMHNNVTKIIEKRVIKAPQGAEKVEDEQHNILYYRTQEIDLQLKTTVSETRYFLVAQGEELSQKQANQYAINSVAYAPHFISMVLYLNNKGGIALERLCCMLNEMSNNEIHLSPSTVSKWMEKFTKLSEPARQKILDNILKSSVVGTDETGWKVNSKNAWLHTLVTQDNAYFVVTKTRSDKENGPLNLLLEYVGILMHDHFKPYYNLLKCVHVECNAHILRYLKAGFEGYDSLECIKMITLLQKINHQRKELLDKGILQFDEADLISFETEYQSIANQAIKEYNEKYPNIQKKYIPDYIKTFKRMLEYQTEHLLFMRDFHIPFDNNFSERQMRVVKSKKKISGQSNSIETSNHFASILTIMQTCKLQNNNTLKAIEDILVG